MPFNQQSWLPTLSNVPNSPESSQAGFQITDKATWGDIGTPTATVDVASHFEITQTTPWQVLTLPATTTPWARLIVIDSDATSVEFNMYWTTIKPGGSYVATSIDGTNWSIASAEAANNRVHADDTTVWPVTAWEPLLSEVQTFVTNASYTDVVIYYTWDDLPASEPTYVYIVDASGVVTLVKEPASLANDRVFADDTTVAPSTTWEPTAIEIAVFAAAWSHTDTVIYYTGDDFAGNPPTHVFHVDNSGDVTLIEGPFISSLIVENHEDLIYPQTPTIDTIWLARNTGKVTTREVGFGWDDIGFIDTSTLSSSEAIASGDTPTGERRLISATSTVSDPNFVINAPVVKTDTYTYVLSVNTGVTTTFQFSNFFAGIDGGTMPDIVLDGNPSGGNMQVQFRAFNSTTSGQTKLRLITPITAAGGAHLIQVDTVDQFYSLYPTLPTDSIGFASRSGTVAAYKVGDGWIEYGRTDPFSLASSASINSGDTPTNNDIRWLICLSSVNETFLVNAPAAPSGLYGYTLIALSGVTTTFQFSGDFLDVDGTPLQDITINNSGASIEELSLYFLSRDRDDGSTYMQLMNPISKGSGLPQKGIVIPSIISQGIYTAEGTNSATTLYAATNTQDRVMVTSKLAGVGTVISVQAGESLNGVTDGTYTTQSDGELLLFIDNGVGEWTVQVVGASQQKSLTSDFNVGIVDGQTKTGFNNYADVNGGTVTLPNIGTYFVSYSLTVSNNAGNNGGVFRLVDALGNPIEGSYTRAAATANNSRFSPSQIVKIVTTTENEVYKLQWRTTGGTLTMYNSYVSSEANSNISYQQIPSTETVLAGMVVAEPLHYVSIYGGTNTNIMGSATTVLAGTYNVYSFSDWLVDTIYDPNGLVDVANNLVNISQDGIYRLAFNCDTTNTASDIVIRVDGSVVGISDTTNPNKDNRGIDIIIPLVAGQQVEFGSDNSNALDFRTGTIQVQQLPTSTVVNPDGLVPVDLGYARISKTDGTGTAGDGNTNAEVTFNEDTYSSNMIADAANNRITATQDGRYELEFYHSPNGINVDYNVEFRINGVTIESFAIDSNGGAEPLGALAFDADLVSGDNVTVQLVSAGNSIAYKIGGTSAYLNVQQLSTKTVQMIDNGTAVDDQATSGYMDIGDMRMAWWITPGGSGIETVTFPAWGFAAAPVVTFAPVGTTIRAISINSVSATQAVIEDGGAQVKHWHAIGTKA